MKKILAGVTAVAAAVGLAACGTSSLEGAINRECNGPLATKIELTGGPRSGNNAHVRTKGVEVRISCLNGTSHVAHVK